MSRVDVAGGWVELRDPKTVSERLRRPVMAKASQLASVVSEVSKGEARIEGDSLTGMYEFNDLVAVALISEWSFEQPLTVDGMLDLPSATYDEIQKIVAPMFNQLMPSFEADPDPASPTVPSGE